MSLYLTLPGEYESVINRESKLKIRSRRLDAVVSAIRGFIDQRSRQSLKEVERSFDQWKREDPKEFADRGQGTEADFRQELAETFTRLGGREIPVIDAASHPVYNPAKWNDNSVIQYSTNCYAYACDDPDRHKALAKPQPGQFAGARLGEAIDSTVRLAVMMDDQQRDARRMQRLIPLIRMRNEAVPENVVNVPGYYLIALVTAPNVDYHWLRQDADGMWSHKPGWSRATNLDYFGKLIYDPRVATLRVQTRDRRGNKILADYVFTTFYYGPKGGVRTGDLGLHPEHRRNSI